MRRMGALLAAGLVAAALAPPLRAQERGGSRGGTPPPVKLKSESKASALSAVGTIVPVAVFAVGLFAGNGPADIATIGALAIPFGPSLGYFYADATGRAFIGIGIRLAGLAGIIGGSWGLDNGDANDTLMKAFIITGAGALVASTVIDLAGVKRAVRRHNLKAQGPRLALAPVVSPRTGTFGLQARLSF